MRADFPEVIKAPARNEPFPLLDDEFDNYNPLHAYGEGFLEQSGALDACVADPVEA